MMVQVPTEQNARSSERCGSQERSGIRLLIISDNRNIREYDS